MSVKKFDKFLSPNGIQITSMVSIANIGFILPDVMNIILLIVSLVLMYKGIEILHPIYGCLFCNLGSALLTSVTEIFLLVLVTEFRTTTIIKACCTFYILFHCSTWAIISILRYAYIVHPDWLHDKFLDHRVLLITSLVLIYSSFMMCGTAIVGVIVYCGWPYIEAYEMDISRKLACILTSLTSYLLLLGVSCYSYHRLLRRKGAIGQNRVMDISVIEAGNQSLNVSYFSLG